MSVELSFWKYKGGAAHEDGKIYELACCDGETVEGLETLPIEDILQKLASSFSDWTALDQTHYEKEGRGAFEIFTTPQIVGFACYGMQVAAKNALMDALLAFGCPLYDPQIATRFDSWTDR